MSINTLKEKLKSMNSKDKSRWLLIIIAAAVVLLIYFSSFAGEKKENSVVLNDGIEKRLEQAICEMEGVKSARVVINYESSGEKIPATSTDTTYGETDSRQKTEITTISGSALILKERLPEVRGVIVVADGAQDIGVRTNIISAVTTLLGVTADKVEILY